VSDESSTLKATEVRLGDRVRTRTGLELTVTRIDESFLDRPEMIAFVEDTDTQWLKMPTMRDGDVELVARAGQTA
jgi:hypothetical protein